MIFTKTFSIGFQSEARGKCKNQTYSRAIKPPEWGFMQLRKKNTFRPIWILYYFKRFDKVKVNNDKLDDTYLNMCLKKLLINVPVKPTPLFNLCLHHKKDLQRHYFKPEWCHQGDFALEKTGDVRFGSQGESNKRRYQVALWEMWDPVFLFVLSRTGTKSQAISASAAQILTILSK